MIFIRTGSMDIELIFSAGTSAPHKSFTFRTFRDNIEEANPIDQIEYDKDAWEENKKHEIHPRSPHFLSVDSVGTSFVFV